LVRNLRSTNAATSFKDGLCNAKKAVDSCAYYYLLGSCGTSENLIVIPSGGIEVKDESQQPSK
jgi:hypothetical protein